MATVRVAADMHLIGAEVAMPRMVYSAVTRRSRPIAKVANVVVKISQIIEANDYGLIGVGAASTLEGSEFYCIVIQDMQLKYL